MEPDKTGSVNFLALLKDSWGASGKRGMNCGFFSRVFLLDRKSPNCFDERPKPLLMQAP